MAAQQNFRTALNGFNREDVVRYIEYLNTKHAAEVNQLKSELDFLHSKAEMSAPVAEAAPVDTAETDAMIEQQAARIRELFDQCKAQEQEISELKAENQQLNNRLSEIPSQSAVAPVVVQNVDTSDLEQEISALKAEKEALTLQIQEMKQQSIAQTSAELEAYRRAERTERMARERAAKVYQQANGVLADATVKVDEAADQIGTLTEQVMAQLSQLQTAVSGSKEALRDAASTMYTLRPSEDCE